MKKKILMPFAAIMALASCSSDEMVEQSVNPSGEPIIRFGAVVDNNTRAGVEAKIDALKTNGFKVKANYFETSGTLGNEFFPAQDATYAKEHNEKGHFTLGHDYLWPDGNLAFSAWSAPSDFDLTQPYVINAENGGNLTTGTNDYSTDKDLLVAYTEVLKENQGQCVDLNFQHALSQIVINGKTDGKVKVTVKDLRIKWLKNKATLTFPTTKTDGNTKIEWAFTEDNCKVYAAETETDGFKSYLWKPNVETDAVVLENNTAKPITSVEGSFLVIPQKFSYTEPADADKETKKNNWNTQQIPYLCMTIKVEAYNEKNELYTVENSVVSAVDLFKVFNTAGNEGIEAGKRYVFTLNFTSDGLGNTDTPGGDPIAKDPIAFDVTVTEWTSTENIDVPKDETTTGGGSTTEP